MKASRVRISDTQSRISSLLLLAIRQTELSRGTLLAHHGRHPMALRPTQARLHKITDRRARKLAARYRAHAHVYHTFRTGEPVHVGAYWSGKRNVGEFRV